MKKVLISALMFAGVYSSLLPNKKVKTVEVGELTIKVSEPQEELSRAVEKTRLLREEADRAVEKFEKFKSQEKIESPLMDLLSAHVITSLKTAAHLFDLSFAVANAHATNVLQQKEIKKLRARISKLEGKPKKVALGKRRSRRA